MAKYKNKYRVESNRHRYWDYSWPGYYYITICVINRECTLGKIIDGKMYLSESGQIVQDEILNIPQYNERLQLGEWVVMPNHIHMIIEIMDGNADGDGGGDGDGDNVEKIHEFSLPKPPPQPPTRHPQQPQSQSIPWWYNPDYKPTIDEIKQYRKQRRKMIIPKTIGKMKMLTSKNINILRHTEGRKNWQHDYYDHIIRNQQSLDRISNYIKNNPRNWNEDKFYKDEN